MTITNRYLKKSIEEMSNFLTNHTQLPEDLVFTFVTELRVSNLLIPAIVKEGKISFPHMVGENGLRMLPLFSDDVEFSKYTTDLKAVPNEFEYYRHIVNNLEFDGIVINCKGDEFFIDRELINNIPPVQETEGGGFDAEKLRQIALNVKNDELVSFIGEDANFNKTYEAIEILKRSYLLNVVLSDEDLSEYVEDGIIRRVDIGGFVVSKERVGLNDYPALFTSRQAAEKSRKINDYHYYLQVANLHEIIVFALTNDLDGIMINPGLEEYYIPRHCLIRMLDDEELMNPDLANAVDYAFEF